MLNLSSLKHHMWVLEESVGLIRASLCSTNNNISKHLRLFFTLWCTQRERQKDGEMGSNSFHQQSGRKHNCRVLQANHGVMIWHCTKASAHSLPSIRNSDDKGSKTAHHQGTTPWWLCRFLSVHSRTILFRFDYHWSIVVSIHRQIAYTYKWITATWRFLFIGLPWMNWVFYFGGAIGTHLWFLKAKNVWCFFDVLCVKI